MKKILTFVLVSVMIISSLALYSSAEDLENVAEGCQYTVDIGEDGTPGYGYEEGQTNGLGDGPNAELQRLTDGVMVDEPINAGVGGYPGAQKTPKAVYIIDLGEVVDGIEKFNMDMYSRADWGIDESISVEYALSTDGNEYTTVGKVLKKDAVDVSGDSWTGGHHYILELAEAESARYVKVIAEAGNYIWSTEIQVFADQSSSGGEQSSDPDDSSEPEDESSEPENESSTDDNPITGDYGKNTIFVIISVLSVVAIYTVANKRRKEY